VAKQSIAVVKLVRLVYRDAVLLPILSITRNSTAKHSYQNYRCQNKALYYQNHLEASFDPAGSAGILPAYTSK
jgi:hypothetical protein